jgi:hypothetical protein
VNQVMRVPPAAMGADIAIFYSSITKCSWFNQWVRSITMAGIWSPFLVHLNNRLWFKRSKNPKTNYIENSSIAILDHFDFSHC